MKTKVVLVGGFLGAGKTTLLGEISRKLCQEGKNVGLITNDQASELVDTVFLEKADADVAEVSGSCFCCNFPGFVDAMDHINSKKKVDVIIAEPVGSCTDLSATILQPLKEKFADALSLAPLSVLVDPQQLNDILTGKPTGMHPSAVYILKKQLEEADLIVINKADLLSPEEMDALKKRTVAEWPWAAIHVLSAKTGEGVDQWLGEALHSSEAGTRLAEVDYDTYAEGEAVLGWLNATIELESAGGNWDDFAEKLMNSLINRFNKADAAIGHVKALVETDNGFVVANVTGAKNLLTIRGSAGIGTKAKLTLNARTQMEPEALQSVALEEVAQIGGENIKARFAALKCLKPGRPNPTYRYDYIVN